MPAMPTMHALIRNRWVGATVLFLGVTAGTTGIAAKVQGVSDDGHARDYVPGTTSLIDARDALGWEMGDDNQQIARAQQTPTTDQKEVDRDQRTLDDHLETLQRDLTPAPADAPTIAKDRESVDRWQAVVRDDQVALTYDQKQGYGRLATADERATLDRDRAQLEDAADRLGTDSRWKTAQFTTISGDRIRIGEAQSQLDQDRQQVLADARPDANWRGVQDVAQQRLAAHGTTLGRVNAAIAAQGNHFPHDLPAGAGVGAVAAAGFLFRRRQNRAAAAVPQL